MQATRRRLIYVFTGTLLGAVLLLSWSFRRYYSAISSDLPVVSEVLEHPRDHLIFSPNELRNDSFKNTSGKAVVLNGIPAELRKIAVELYGIPAQDFDCAQSSICKLKNITFLWASETFGVNTLEVQDTIATKTARLFLPKKECCWRGRVLYFSWDLLRSSTQMEMAELLLNNVYFGCGVLGVEDASIAYFGKRTNELSPVQFVLVASLPSMNQRTELRTNSSELFRAVASNNVEKFVGIGNENDVLRMIGEMRKACDGRNGIHPTSGAPSNGASNLTDE